MLPYSKKSMPELGENRFSLFEMGGGLNNVESDYVIADNECSDNKNMRFLSTKLMEKRYGTSLVDNFICGDNVGGIFEAKPILWLDEYKSNGNESRYIKCTKDAMYVDNVKVITLNGSKISGVNYLNKYYLVDGTQIIVYDGVNAFIIDYIPRITKLTEVLAIGGSTIKLESTDAFVVGEQIQIETKGFYESMKITDINEATKTITFEPVSNYVHSEGDTVRSYIPVPKQVITSVLSANAAIGALTISTSLIDYRIQAGWVFKTVNNTSHTVSSVNRVTGVITFTPALTYAYVSTNVMYFDFPNIESYFVGITKKDLVNNKIWYEPCDYELDADFLGENIIPKNPSVILEHNDRIFLSGLNESPHEVHMSDISNELYFPIFTGLQIPPTGDEIVNMTVFDNSLVVSRNGDMHVIRGNNPDASVGDAFTINKMDTHIGMMSNHCTAILNNFMFYLGYDKKFYKCNSPASYIEYLMTSPLSRKIDIELEPLSITSVDLQRVSAAVYNNQYVILIGSKVIIYSFDNQAFTYFTGLNASCLYCDGVDLFFGKNDGTMAKYDKTIYNDVGSAYEALFYTKRFSFKNPMNFKYFKNCMLTTHAWNDYLSELQLDFEIDIYDTKISKIINSNQSKFGTAQWGDRFSDRNIFKSSLINLDYKGRDIKIKLKNGNINEPMRIYNINIIYLDRDVR